MKTLHHRENVLSQLYSAAHDASDRPGKLDWDKDKVREEMDNDELRDMFTRPASDHPAEPSGNPRLDRMLRNAGVAFAYGFAPANTAASVEEMPAKQAAKVKTRDFIQFPRPDAFADGLAGYRRTLAHELVHWSGTEDRAVRRSNTLGLDMLDQLLGIVPPGYAREEMTAEMGATLLIDELGEDPHMEDRARYIANWASAIRDPAERESAYRIAKEDAQKAVDWLLQFDHD